jgi:hypothetical protein
VCACVCVCVHFVTVCQCLCSVCVCVRVCVLGCSERKHKRDMRNERRDHSSVFLKGVQWANHTPIMCEWWSAINTANEIFTKAFIFHRYLVWRSEVLL